MYIVSVIPLLPGISKDTLTYSSERALTLGSVIAAPFRNKTIDCVVIEQRSVREAKTDLRNATFSVKKIPSKNQSRNLISKHYIDSLIQCAHYYGITYSECFNLLLPRSLFSADFSINQVELATQGKKNIEYKEILQADTSEYYSKESKEGLRIIVVPTKERANFLKKNMPGSEPIILHSGISTLKQTKVLSNISNTGLYICTPQFVAFFHNADKIYLDNFSSGHYTSKISPYISAASVLKEYSLKVSSCVVAVDSILLENIQESPSFSFRALDMTDSANGSKYIWQSNHLQKLLEHNKKNKKNTLLYVHRKGLSSYLSCNDCKTVAECECGAPLVLFEPKDGLRKLVCSACKKTSVLDKERVMSCGICGSWKIQGYGVSTEGVANDLKEEGYPTFLIDSEHTKTPLRVRDAYQEFIETPGGVLVATELCLDYLTEQIDSVCIVSIDSLLLMPEYATDMRVLRRVRDLSSYSKTGMFVQTRLPKNPIWNVTDSEKYGDWKKEYLEQTEEYDLPPSGTWVKISKNGYFNDEEKKIIDAAFDGLKYSRSSFRTYSYVTARIPKKTWSDTDKWLAYKISLLRKTCEVFIV